MSFSRDLKLSILLERHSRFVQKLRSNKVRAVKHSIDEGSSLLISVKPKLSSDRLFIIPVNFGIVLIFEQSQRSRTLRDSISADMLGRSVRDSHFHRCKYLSLLSCPIDGWISTKLTHPERFSSSSLGTPEKSGVLIRFRESLRSMNFKLNEHCTQKIKKSFH